VVSRDHTATQLAVDEHGRKIDARSDRAVAWSATGALIKVAPNRAPGGPSHTWAAWLAYLELQAAAEDAGYRSVVEVDQAGAREVWALFSRALNQELEPFRRRDRAAVGSRPRGDEPV
jgi:hypothetical protein